MKYISNLLIAGTLILSGCATVDVTKTGAGYYDPVPAASIEILKTRPDRPYVELATIDVTGFAPSDTAKMHNAIRSKAAPIGASAVILTDESVLSQPFVGPVKYVSGVAIRYK